MEATSEQRQKLLEAIFRRNELRLKSCMPPLNITMAYARGLNRILRMNLAGQQSPKQGAGDGGAMPGQVVRLYPFGR